MKFILNLKKKRDLCHDEEYYIDRIIFIQKECWRNNMTESFSLKETKRYLNKLNLSEEKHSFLIEYRAKLNDILRYDVSLMRYRIDELSRSLFAYRNELKNKDNNSVK